MLRAYASDALTAASLILFIGMLMLWIGIFASLI